MTKPTTDALITLMYRFLKKILFYLMLQAETDKIPKIICSLSIQIQFIYSTVQRF